MRSAAGGAGRRKVHHDERRGTCASGRPASASRPTASTSSTSPSARARPPQLFWPWCAVERVGAGGVLRLLRARLRARASRRRWSPRWSVRCCRSCSSGWSRSPASAARRRPWCCRARRSAGSATCCPGGVSYLLLVGWETVLVSLATFATATVFGRLGWGDGDLTKVVAFLVVAGVIVAAGILGFDAIMRLQKWLTVAMIVVTLALHRAHLRPRRPRRGRARCEAGSFSAVRRRHHPGDDRLRGGLGQLRGRLLPLPAAHRLDAAAWSSGRRSAAACRW